ncbi:SusF/SusE family outer membrane protein [Lutibacter flavus]|nr:SusF/SusE family outer membrane protein [Lutibacter flavus]
MMKYLNKIIVLLVFSMAFIACDENENFEILPAQESFQIVTPSNGSVIVLNDTNLDNNALFISWEANNQTDATFNVEAAKTGTDFATSYLIGTTQESSFGLTVDELNDFLLDVMDLNPEEASSIDLRISANENVSQVVSVILTPYKVEYSEFYLVGSLTGWDPATSLPMTNTGFNTFEITVDLADGDAFKFLPQNTGWDGDWGKDPNNDGSLISEGEQDLSGFTAGKYKINIDLNTFTYTVEEITSPGELYIVGSLNGWDPANAYPMNLVSEGVFALAIDITDGTEFKFLPQNTGWDGDWGSDPNNPGSIIQDGENNVSGYAAGKYVVIVDYNTLTFNVSSVNSLNVVGSINGWDNGSALQMGEASLGVFSLVMDLPDGAEFKFLPTLGSWDGDWGADPNNDGMVVQDGENNLSGFAAGKYIVSVNFNTLSYNVSSITGAPSSVFMVGSFRGWSNDADNPEFTQTADGVFEITQALGAGDEFKFVPVAGSWDNDWGQSNASKGVLEQNSEDNVKVETAGNYKITLNFNTGTLSVSLQ